MLIEPIWVLKRDFQHRYGVQIWKNQSRYEGNWLEDKANDEGTFYWPNGRKNKGEWENLKSEWIFLTVMQNSKSRFLHDSNGFSNKANEISSR